MRLGISSFTFPWAVGVPGYPPPAPMDQMELLRRAIALGAEVLQIGDNLPLHLLDERALDVLQSQAEAAGIGLEVGTRGVQPEHLRAYLRLAQRLGSPILRLVTDTATCQPSDDELVALLHPLLPELEKAGVILAIENHGRQTAAQLLAVLERLGSAQVGICLDTANSFGALEMPEAVAELLGPWTVNLHVKDFRVRRLSHQLGYVIEGCPLGEGQLGLEGLLQRLRRYGRCCSAILEQWPPAEDTVAATIAKEAAWAEAGVAHLRRCLDDLARAP